MDCRISMPRAGSSSGVPLIAVTRSPGIRPELGELLPVAPGVDPVAALLAVREHRLRADDLRDRAGILRGELAASARRASAAGAARRGGAAAMPPPLELLRQQQRLELAAPVEDHAVGIDRMQLGAAGDGLADRVDSAPSARFRRRSQSPAAGRRGRWSRRAPGSSGWRRRASGPFRPNPMRRRCRTGGR